MSHLFANKCDAYLKVDVPFLCLPSGILQDFVAIPVCCVVGECPLWDNLRQSLFWIDIEGKMLFRLCWDHRTVERWDLGQLYPNYGRPGCIALCVSGRLLFAFEYGLAIYDVENESMNFLGPCGEDWAQGTLSKAGYAVRLNDGRVDRAGRLIVGGINFTGISEGYDAWQAVQPCYVVQKRTTRDEDDEDTASCNPLKLTLLTGMSLARISNGICFSPDGLKMYHTDSADKEIQEFDYDPSIGQLCGSSGRVIVRSEHTPDGSITDTGGGLWNAAYEGKRVARYARQPDGVWSETLAIELPASQATCPCIGGPNGDLLFVTTACNWYSEERKAAEPLAGSLLIYRLPNCPEYKANETRFAD